MFKQFIKNKIASYILTLTLALSIILGLLVGAWLSGRYYQKEIHSTRAALDECKSNSQKLLTEVEHQNAGITTIREMGKIREENARKRLQEVQQSVLNEYQEAKEILSKPFPLGDDACREAQRAFRDEQRRENNR